MLFAESRTRCVGSMVFTPSCQEHAPRTLTLLIIGHKTAVYPRRGVRQGPLGYVLRSAAPAPPRARSLGPPLKTHFCDQTSET